jgi:hypothetical protein
MGSPFQRIPAQWSLKIDNLALVPGLQIHAQAVRFTRRQLDRFHSGFRDCLLGSVYHGEFDPAFRAAALLDSRFCLFPFFLFALFCHRISRQAPLGAHSHLQVHFALRDTTFLPGDDVRAQCPLH